MDAEMDADMDAFYDWENYSNFFQKSTAWRYFAA